ncbi:MAG: HAD family hydrolase [Chthoniobacterales bacterium]
MKPRAVICDVYRTILEILPAPAEAETRWQELCRATFGAVRVPDLGAFNEMCRAEIARDHEEARRRGIAFPEVQWPRMVASVLPQFAEMEAARQSDFILAGQSLTRGLRLLPGAADVLKHWSESRLPLGIASNAQAYTLRELDAELRSVGLQPGIFAPDLVLWSWQLGFSKPDPYFFQTLLARLRARGLGGGVDVIVGEPADNDIAPARAAGLMTWHLHPEGHGDWRALREALS